MQTKGRSHKMMFLFLSANCLPWMQCHLLYPINYCNMAAVCIHDGRMICASTSDGCNRRSFLDQCDMYEFNCDYGTQYTSKGNRNCGNVQVNFCARSHSIESFNLFYSNPRSHNYDGPDTLVFSRKFMFSLTTKPYDILTE